MSFYIFLKASTSCCFIVAVDVFFLLFYLTPFFENKGFVPPPPLAPLLPLESEPRRPPEIPELAEGSFRLEKRALKLEQAKKQSAINTMKRFRKMISHLWIAPISGCKSVDGLRAESEADLPGKWDPKRPLEEVAGALLNV